MRVPRIYHPEPLQLDQIIDLTEEAANHVGRVLRLGQGARLELFCGDLHAYAAEIQSASKKHVQVKVLERTRADSESPVKLHLAQGISRGDRMDFVLQKSVELGVHEITPLFTERCTVKLQGERLEKKVQQWQRIVISACEQSGRNFVPVVHTPVALTHWLQQYAELTKVVLDPLAASNIAQLEKKQAFGLLIGPEGGFSAQEVELCQTHEAIGVRLGPRILRTETAALAAITALQLTQGDL